LLAYRLNTVHNVHFFVGFLRRIREAVRAGRLEAFRNDFYATREI
jgi:queuine tRNA-ribosyltransferase